MSRDDPGRGDVRAVAMESWRISGLASDFVTGSTVLATVAGVAETELSGAAAAAFTVPTAVIRSRFAAFAGWLDANAAAYDVYAAALADIQERSRALMRRDDELESEMSYARMRLLSARDEVDVAREAGDETQVAKLRARTAVVERQLEELRDEARLGRRHLDELAEERRKADAVLVAALEAAIPPGLQPAGGFDSSVFGSPTSLGSREHMFSEMELLRLLSEMTPSMLARWIADHPRELARLEEGGLPPEEVAVWWLSLNPGASPDTLSRQQKRLIAAMPQVFGNLDGITYTGRDKANRFVLQDVADNGNAANRAAAKAVLKALKVGPTDAVHQLISYHPGAPPLAAISVGNLDTAAYVNFMVSGMGTRLEGDAVAWTRQARALYWQEAEIASLGHSMGGVATVAWLGYEAPPIPVLQEFDFGVIEGAYARDGAPNLVRDLSGLLTVRAATGTDPFLSVMGHSYGSTVAANALTRVEVDSFTILGSAGIEHHDRDDFRVPEGQLFVAQADERAPWALVGRTGSGRLDPQKLDGASVWHPVDATIDGTRYEGTDVHETVNDNGHGYLEQKTTSLYNTALAGLGLGDQIVPREPAEMYLYTPLTPAPPIYIRTDW